MFLTTQRKLFKIKSRLKLQRAVRHLVHSQIRALIKTTSLRLQLPRRRRPCKDQLPSSLRSKWAIQLDRLDLKRFRPSGMKSFAKANSKILKIIAPGASKSIPAGERFKRAMEADLSSAGADLLTN